MIYALSNLDIALLIGVGAAIIIGALIFFLAGVYHVKKGYEVIIEKANEYYTTLKEGWHFKMPIVYQRAGTYCVAAQVRRYISQAGNKLSITYEVEDSKVFHYCGYNFEAIMLKIEKENSEITLPVLQDSFAKYGLKFLNIQKVD